MYKSKNIIILSISFIFLNLVIYFFTENNQNQRIELSLKNHIDKLKINYEILLHQQKLTANGIFESTVIKDDVLNIVTKAYETEDTKKRDDLRDDLYKLLKNKYKRMLKKGVFQFHFVFPDNEVFLRFHKVSKYGDNLTGIRTDFEYSNKTKKTITGFAQGRTEHAFRNVYPLINKNSKHIGAMEISFSSDSLQENFTLISKMHTHFLVNKKIFTIKAWERDDLILKYNQSAEHPDYMMTMTKMHTKKKCIDERKEKIKSILFDIDANIKKDKEFSLYTDNGNGEVLSLAFLPVYSSIGNQILAWIVANEKDEFINISIKNTFYIRLTLFTILVILFSLIYRALNQKETLKEIVTQKTTELKDINENLEQKIIIELEKNKKAQEQLYKSEKMASMGEMIGNIAHQWRQPLSVISTSSTGMQLQIECGLYDDKQFFKACETINEHAQYLSKTIDDFRNFIKGDRESITFNLTQNIDSFLHLVASSIKKEHINIILDLDDNITLNGYPNELSQCFINIFNNSNDIFKNQEYEKYLFITTKVINNQTIIIFKDNAGGIPSDIMKKIFEPYFTTKHQSQGTGLGLHMTYNIIVEGMKGSIEAKNNTYTYNDKVYNGAEFIISLPKL